MRPSVIITALVAGAVCFAAGWWTGNDQDRWKIAQQSSCIANVRIVDPGPPRTSRPQIGVVSPRLVTLGGRRAAILAAIQQIEGCDSQAGLATIDSLSAQRLNAMMIGAQ
jgi:hypothetical protein